jgi:hypothetical protein
MTESDIQNINLPDSEGVIPQIVFGPRNRESSWDRSNPAPAGLVGTEPRPERHNEQAQKRVPGRHRRTYAHNPGDSCEPAGKQARSGHIRRFCNRSRSERVS